MMKKISIIIVTYNSEHHIYDCLNSIFVNNDVGDDLEVIVVDNCSCGIDEMEKRICHLYGDKVKVIRNSSNGGYGQGNNVGIRSSHAPIVMIMNPDVRMIMPVFVKAIEQFAKYDKIAVLGMKQRIPGERGRSFGWSYRAPFWMGELLYPLCRIFDLYLQRYMYFQGSCFFIKKKAFERIGMFDENIFMYSEEDDLHWRFHKYGYLYRFVRTLEYQHLHKENSDGIFSVSCKVQDLKSKIYMDQRDGLGDEYTVSRMLKHTNMQILFQTIKKMMGIANVDYIYILTNFRLLLQNRSF